MTASTRTRLRPNQRMKLARRLCAHVATQPMMPAYARFVRRPHRSPLVMMQPIWGLLSLATLALSVATFSPAHPRGSQTQADTVAWTIRDTVMVNPPGEGCCYGIGAFHLAVQGPNG